MTEPAMTFNDLPDETVEHIAVFTDLSTIKHLSLVARKYRKIAADVKDNNAFWNQYLITPVPVNADKGAALFNLKNVKLRNEDGLLLDKIGREYYANGWLYTKIVNESTRDGIDTSQHPEIKIYLALQYEPIKNLFIRGELKLKQFDDPTYLCFAALKEQLKETHHAPFTLVFPYNLAGPYQFSDAQLDELLPLAKNNTYALYPFPREFLVGKADKEKLFNAYMERNRTLEQEYPVTSFKDRWANFFFDLILETIAPKIYYACVYGGLGLFSLYPLALLINKIGDTRSVSIPMFLFSYSRIVEIVRYRDDLNTFNTIVAVPLGFIGAHVGSFVGFFIAAIVGVALIPFMTLAAAIIPLGEMVRRNFAERRLNRDLTALEKTLAESPPQPEAQPNIAPTAYAAVSQLPVTTTVEIAAQPDDEVNPPLPSAAAAAIQVPTEALSTGSSVDPAASPVPSM